jgi:hypothetical protein
MDTTETDGPAASVAGSNGGGIEALHGLTPGGGLLRIVRVTRVAASRMRPVCADPAD